MPTLDIAPEKAVFVMIKAREFDAKVAPFDDGDTETADEQFGAVLENRRDDTTLRELLGFMRGLNEDEEANLIAIAWIGRGTFEPEDWEEAVETARTEHNPEAARYLLSLPLLAEYLEVGLEALGISVAEIESNVRAAG